MITQHPSPHAVRRFYDAFLQSRMLSYRLQGSPRIDAALRMVLPHIRRDSRVLDIGCGIGMAAERVAIRARDGFVWACDLSESNIWYARSTVRRPNAEFFVCDVIDDFEPLRRRIPGPLDAILLLDVVEHIPSFVRASLFERLRALAREGGLLVLTYPSPAYQNYLRHHEPEEMQPIDEVVHAVDVVAAAEAAGFHLHYYNVVDVFRRAQYVHCIFRVGDSCDPIVPSLRARLGLAARAIIDRYVRVPLRRRRYVTQVFGHGSGDGHAP
jgi:trans-aconitate 2-methyltransferase